MELPPETVNSTLGAHDAINEWMDTHEIYDEERAKVHDILDAAVRSAHSFALAGAGSRILTTSEVADRLNISAPTLRKRLAEASPPILPAKVVGGASLYMVEDLPAIAMLHMQGVIADGQNTRYVAAKLRKSIAAVKHQSTIKRLRKDGAVRWPDIDGTPRTYRVEVAKKDGLLIDKTARDDGWTDTNHLLRAFILAYNEFSRRKEK